MVCVVEVSAIHGVFATLTASVTSDTLTEDGVIHPGPPLSRTANDAEPLAIITPSFSVLDMEGKEFLLFKLPSFSIILFALVLICPYARCSYLGLWGILDWARFHSHASFIY